MNRLVDLGFEKIRPEFGRYELKLGSRCLTAEEQIGLSRVSEHVLDLQKGSVVEVSSDESELLGK